MSKIATLVPPEFCREEGRRSGGQCDADGETRRVLWEGYSERIQQPPKREDESGVEDLIWRVEDFLHARAFQVKVNGRVIGQTGMTQGTPP